MEYLKYEHLLGMEWEHIAADCYALVRGFYFDNWALSLPDYPRAERWWERSPEDDLLMRNFRHAGFFPVTTEDQFQITPGDVLLMARGTQVVSHCGVWIGGNRFLHHPFGGVSCIDRWAGKWAGQTMAVVRHPKVPPPPPLRRVDVIELMPPMKRELYRQMLLERVGRQA